MTLWVPDLASGFVNANQRSSTRMTTLYGFQPFTCGFGCKTAWFAPEWQDYIATSHHLWFCACKTAPLGLELQVSVGQRPHLCFFMQNSDFKTRLTSVLGFQPSPVVLSMQSSDFSTWIASLYGSQPSSVVFACKTATLGLELQVSVGPRPHLWFLHAKQRLLEQNYNYLCVTALICGFCIHNSSFWTRISSLYGSQTSSVVLSTHNCVLNTRI